MLKGMDNESIKTMMKAQGMNISDEQISMMRNPDMLHQAQKQIKNNPNLMNKNYNQSNSNEMQNVSNQEYRNQKSNNSESCSNQVSSSQPRSPFPNLSSFPKNMDMSSMMDFVSKNPDFLKNLSPQLSQMFGGKDGSVPPQLETVLYLLSLPQKIRDFFRSTQGKIIVGLVICLIISFFYR